MTKFKTTTVKWKDEEDAKLFFPAEIENDDSLSGNDFDIDEEEAHTNLIHDITKISKKKKMGPAPRKIRASAKEGGTEVDSLDILKRLGKADVANAAKKIETLPKPQEKVVLRRLKRAAGFEKVSVDSEKWSSLVHKRRLEEQLTFPLQKPDLSIYNTLKTEEIKMHTPLEQEVYTLLQGARLMEDKKLTNEEIARKRAMSLEELKERSKLAWKQKEQKRRMELKAWRENKNKSRKFHRLLRRDRLKKQKSELEQLEKNNPEAALEKLEELERARVEERMTLRHKQSKWAHLQGFRATRDQKAMAALKENRDMHQELLAKRKREELSSEDEDNIEEKLEELQKERQAALEAGLFDPSNPWTAGLMQQFPERVKVTPDSAVDDSFVNFKKFWDEVNRRRLLERKAQEVAEAKRKKIEEENEKETDDDVEEKIKNNANDAKKKKLEEEKEKENGDDCEDMENDGNEENDLKKGIVNEEIKKKVEIPNKKTKKETLKGKKKKKMLVMNKRREETDNTNNIKDGESKVKMPEAKEKQNKKVQKGKLKKEKVTGCKNIKKVNTKDIDKKKLKKDVGKKNIKNNNGDRDAGENVSEIGTETMKEVKGGKKKTIKKRKTNKDDNINNENDKNNRNIKSKKGKKSMKKSLTEGNTKKAKVVKKEKKKSQETEENSKGTEDIDMNDNDLEDQLISIDNLFNQAELNLQKKLKKKLEKLGINADPDKEWTKVGSKKGKKKFDNDNSKSILPKIEEFDFTSTKNEENIDEGLMRAQTMEDMDALQNKIEDSHCLQKAAKTVLAAGNRKTKSDEAAKTPVKPAVAKVAQVDPSKFIEVDTKTLLTAMPDTIIHGEDGTDEEEDNEAADIIREAFADDYLVDEFKSEKDAAREQDKAKSLCLALPGWGSWTGPNIKMSDKVKRRFTIRAPKPAPRKDDSKNNVIYDEKADVHPNLRKVMVSDLPFPFSSVKEFEASVRAPIGRMFIPEKQHQNLTAPPLVTKLGAVIEPMTEEELLKYDKYSKPSKRRKDDKRY